MPHRIPEIGPAPFITFYSFKGGVGRSMAVMNIGSLLATRGFRVLVLDMDLEAPGASYLLQNQNKQQEQNQIPPQHLLGFVDLFGEANTKGEDADMGVLTPSEIIAKYTHPLALFEIPEGEDVVKNPGGQLRIMPAGRPGTDYARRLQDLDLPGLYQEGVGKPLIGAFKKIIQDSNEFDFVLVDSRTGFSDESGICTRDLADRLVVITGLNHQNVEGTAAFFRALRACTDGSTPVQVVLSPVPQGEDELVSQREEVARSAFEEAWGKPLDLSLQIPYHPRLALTEQPYFSRRFHSEVRNAYWSIESDLLVDLGLTPARVLTDGLVAIDEENYELVLPKLLLARHLEHFQDVLCKIAERLRSTNFMNQKPVPSNLKEFLVSNLPLTSEVLGSMVYDFERKHDEVCSALYACRLKTAPKNADLLFAHARLLESLQSSFHPEWRPTEPDSVNEYYRLAAEADCENPDDVADQVFELFWRGNQEQGKRFLEKALRTKGISERKAQRLYFTAYSSFWLEFPSALHGLKELLLSGARWPSPNFDCNNVLNQAKSQGHPHPDLVAALAAVIWDQAPIESLDAFPIWQATQALPPADPAKPAS